MSRKSTLISAALIWGLAFSAVTSHAADLPPVTAIDVLLIPDSKMLERV
jgi:hypothetical protein